MKPFPGGVRGFAALLTLMAVAGVPLAHRFAPRDGWSWLPPEGRIADQGRDTAERFGYARLWQVTLVLDDPFAASTRARLAAWEDQLAKWPELARVIGPADVRPLDAPGGKDDSPYTEQGAAGADAAARDAAVRTRLRSRGDVRGWFLGRDERVVRLYVACDGCPDGELPRSKLVSSAHAAGLDQGELRLYLEPVWPRPAVAALRGDWRAALVAASVVVLTGFLAAFVSALARRRRSVRRLMFAAAASSAGLALPFVAAPSGPWRAAGLALAAAAAAPFLAALAARGPVSTGRSLVLGPWARTLGLFSSCLVLGALLANAVRGRPWLVSYESVTASGGVIAVEADLEEPVVLAEMLRLTDFLRAQPAISEAWSPADAFVDARVGFAGHGTLAIDRTGVRHLWQQARDDGAVTLGLSPAHDAALVVFRFRSAATVRQRAEAMRILHEHLAHDLRTELLPVNVEDATLPPATRALGRGILAADAKERLAHLAAAAGTPLTRDQLLGLERVARQAAVVPTADAQKLTAAVAALFDEAVRAGKGGHLLARGSTRDRLARAVANQPWESGLAELRAALRTEAAHAEADVEPLTTWLFPKVLAARFDAAVEMNLKALKDATGLPDVAHGTDSHAEDLSRAMEAALIQGMGPVVGVPVAPGTRGAVRFSAWQADAISGDRELAAVWSFRIVALLAAVLVATSLLWFLVLGWDGLAFAAISFGPAAAAFCVRAASLIPVGLPFVLVVGGSLAAGWALAITWAPPLARRTGGVRRAA